MVEYQISIAHSCMAPLLKKDKALRPIACSEVLRRVAAKVIAGRLSTEFASVLTPKGQIGVAVSSGLEALASWARQTALLLEEDEVVVKIDYANAFNSVSRSAIAEAVLELVPELAHYVLGAYGAPTLLFCGSLGTISSEVGAQQGDPLGPALFSLAALRATTLAPDLRASLRGTGWYLDDGLLVGKAPMVHKALESIRVQSAAIGLKMNLSKTEVITDNPDHWEPYVEAYPFVRPLTDFELLGLPCSPNPAGLQSYVDRFVSRLSARTKAIRSVAESDPHVGFLMLRMCTGFSASVHLARAMGPLPEFVAIDNNIIEAMDAIVPLNSRERRFAELPFRHGGLGLRATSDHAAAAFVAQSIETRHLMKLFSTIALPHDPRRVIVDFRVPECVKSLVTEQEPRQKPDPKLQRLFSAAIDDHKKVTMCLSDDETIRTNSCGSRGASMYLVGPLTYDDKLHEMFMEPTVFVSAIKLRLGQSVQPSDGICALCNMHDTDEKGHSALKCMKCGARTHAHNALRDTLAGLCRDALITPSLEARPWASNLRIDIVFGMSGGLWLVDVAITHPFRDTYRAKALETPGGAATAYEAVKHAKYGEYVKTGTQKLVPFVMDTLGAFGASALECARRIAPLYGRRLGLPSSVASRIVLGRLTTCVVRRMAMIATLA
eukprot:GILJ01016264.1.p1 GENE.GILJ01016264.1~~GILJ01016264.1.p1  ORF type:complete len:664 (-),score=53.02 GILJ01016264.1:80-2071(-)